jgi:hypothetical protein
VVSASAAAVTGRFTEPCIATSSATPCTTYLNATPSANVQISWQSTNASLLDIKRITGVGGASPQLETLRLSATANGSMAVPFFTDRKDELQLFKAGTNELLGTLLVNPLYDVCLGLPLSAPQNTCGSKNRSAILTMTPAQSCTIAANANTCDITATITEALPVGVTDTCIVVNAFQDPASCGPQGFSKLMAAKPFAQNVQLYDLDDT